MRIAIRSLHHLTATAADAQDDLDFYSGRLGLRLVKKTVNFDNHNVFHFYYGDEVGTPSTIMTTFPYKGWGVRIGSKGAGQITETAFSVPRASIPFWRDRLEAAGSGVTDSGRFGDEVLSFADPSGLNIELIGADDDRTPWTERVGADSAIRGLHSVTLRIREPGATLDFLYDVLGFHIVAEEHGRTRVAVGTGGPGRMLDVVHDAAAPQAVNGLGTVHHVALAVDSGDTQATIREELLGLGVKVTEIRDRQYFTSIYFREPGGVLYEIATTGPGFTVDESRDALGRGLKLPPWEEPHRAEIEAGLPGVVVG